MNKISNSRQSLLAIVMLGLCVSSQGLADSSQISLLRGYADIALNSYSESLKDAQSLKNSISKLASQPTEKNLKLAKQAWLNSRESYGVTEIFRLSNGPIDAEEGWVARAYGNLEGQINAWPLDENMIDYTTDENGNRTNGNIIDTPGIFNPGGEDAEAIDVSSITEGAITALNENGSDANVASGYHAIEFLLWGQDQDYANFTEDRVTPGALVAGQRPLSDFTTDKNARRRLQFLQAAAEKLVSDLSLVTSAWLMQTSSSCDADATGCYRAALLGQLSGMDKSKNIQTAVALRQIISGMGVFIKSELANERIAVALLTPSEEDEHSCFSDNTHRDITLNYQGFVNILKANLAGKSYGTSMYTLASKNTQSQIDQLISTISSRIDTMNVLAARKWHFDYQIMAGNNIRDLRNMKNEMRKLGDNMISVAKDIGLSLTTADVTDSEETQI